MIVRLGCQVYAGYEAIHVNVCRQELEYWPSRVVLSLLIAVACDMLQREALLQSKLHDFCGEALSIVSDRINAMVIYGALAIFYT